MDAAQRETNDENSNQMTSDERPAVNDERPAANDERPTETEKDVNAKSRSTDEKIQIKTGARRQRWARTGKKIKRRGNW